MVEDLTENISLFSGQSSSAIHHALRSNRRRLVVIIVASRAIHNESKNKDSSNTAGSATFSVREIAREIVSIEKEVPIRQATGEPYHNVYTSLIQTHLPRLDEIDAIEYDSNRKEIQPDSNLLALSAVAVTSSPLVTLFFNSETANNFAGGPHSPMERD